MAELMTGLGSIAQAIATCARWVCFVYVVGIGCKTFLIYTGKANISEFTDWFKFKESSGGRL